MEEEWGGDPARTAVIVGDEAGTKGPSVFLLTATGFVPSKSKPELLLNAGDGCEGSVWATWIA